MAIITDHLNQLLSMTLIQDVKVSINSLQPISVTRSLRNQIEWTDDSNIDKMAPTDSIELPLRFQGAIYGSMTINQFCHHNVSNQILYEYFARNIGAAVGLELQQKRVQSEKVLHIHLTLHN